MFLPHASRRHGGDDMRLDFHCLSCTRATKLNISGEKSTFGGEGHFFARLCDQNRGDGEGGLGHLLSSVIGIYIED